jgi:hypothetical protein
MEAAAAAAAAAAAVLEAAEDLPDTVRTAVPAVLLPCRM